MTHTLIRGADLVLTMDDAGTELPCADIRLRDGCVAQIGQNLAANGAEIVDALGLPRHAGPREHPSPPVPDQDPRRAAAQDAALFGWLV